MGVAGALVSPAIYRRSTGVMVGTPLEAPFLGTIEMTRSRGPFDCAEEKGGADRFIDSLVVRGQLRLFGAYGCISSGVAIQ